MKNKILISVMILFLSAQSLASNEFTKIKDLVQTRIEKENFGVGVAIIVIDDDDEKFINVGKMYKNSKQNISSNTLFELGSITKTFTSMALASMVSSGKIKLSDPVQDYLPESVSLPILNNKPITFLALANHSSGLVRMPDNVSWDNSDDPFANYNIADMYEFLNNTELEFEVGEGVNYSNLAVGLLGHVLARVDNKTYQQLVIDRVLAPLGMLNTYVDVPKSQDRYISDGHDNKLNKAQPIQLMSLAPAGIIRSNITDMAGYLKANMEHKRLADEFLMTQTPTIKLRRGDSAFGLSWFINTINEKTYFSHGGDTDGFHSFIAFDRAEQKGIVILSNTLVNLDYIAWAYLAGDFANAKQRANAIKLNQEHSQKLIGKYKLESGNVLSISIKDNHLYMKSNNTPLMPFSASSKLTFVSRANQIKLDFEVDDNEQVTSLQVVQPGKVRKAHKIDDVH